MGRAYRVGRALRRRSAHVSFQIITVLAAAALPAALAHAQNNKQPKQQTRSYPFMISMLAADTKRGEEFDRKGCGGSLIAPTWVLTAAHCLENEPDGEGHGPSASPKRPPAAGECFKTRDFDVYAGSANFRNGERLKVVEACRHVNYNPVRHQNDIALLRLERAPKSKASGTVALTTADQEAILATEGADAVLLGWGDKDGKPARRDLAATPQKLVGHAACNTAQLDYRKALIVTELEKFLPEQLKYLGLPFDNDSATAPIYAEMTNAVLRRAGVLVTDTMICAGDATGNKAHCFGDSGGPLIVKDTSGNPLQVGIVSWGENCIREAIPPGVYTRVSAFKDWIAKHVK